MECLKARLYIRSEFALLDLVFIDVCTYLVKITAAIVSIMCSVDQSVQRALFKSFLSI